MISKLKMWRRAVVLLLRLDDRIEALENRVADLERAKMKTDPEAVARNVRRAIKKVAKPRGR